MSLKAYFLFVAIAAILQREIAIIYYDIYWVPLWLALLWFINHPLMLCRSSMIH